MVSRIPTISSQLSQTATAEEVSSSKALDHKAWPNVPPAAASKTGIPIAPTSSSAAAPDLSRKRLGLGTRLPAAPRTCFTPASSGISDSPLHSCSCESSFSSSNSLSSASSCISLTSSATCPTSLSTSSALSPLSAASSSSCLSTPDTLSEASSFPERPPSSPTSFEENNSHQKAEGTAGVAGEGPAASPASSPSPSPSSSPNMTSISEEPGTEAPAPAHNAEKPAAETEEEAAAVESAAAASAAAAARRSGGGLKRKLRKMMRGMFASCVGRSADAL